MDSVALNQAGAFIRKLVHEDELPTTAVAAQYRRYKFRSVPVSMWTLTMRQPDHRVYQDDLTDSTTLGDALGQQGHQYLNDLPRSRRASQYFPLEGATCLSMCPFGRSCHDDLFGKSG
jgi:hypothetical protein